MGICQKCGLELKFIRKPGRGGMLKWFPSNPDGSDHWDSCKAIQRRALGLIRPDGSVDMRRLEQLSPPAYTGQEVDWAYCGAVPPWDDSLGLFRQFTAAEKQESLVCQRTERTNATAN